MAMPASASRKGTGRKSRVRQSISKAASWRPKAEMNWSMMPHCTPMKRFSAFWASKASCLGAMPRASISLSKAPTATS
ncbi:hypothetical protein D3C72_744240 [compost metagenome]